MNEDFQEDLGFDEPSQDAQFPADQASLGDETDFSQPLNPENATQAFEPADAAPSELPNAQSNDLSDEELTQLAVQHIQSIGGNVQFGDQATQEQPQPVQEALVAQQFDQLAQSIAVSLSEEAGADGAAQDVYNFITQLGPDSVAAYQTNAVFRDMVDTKIDSIVGGHVQEVEDRDKLQLPASEEVGGSTEKELRSGLTGHRQAFEKAGLGDHMSFDDFIRDLEL